MEPTKIPSDPDTKKPNKDSGGKLTTVNKLSLIVFLIGLVLFSVGTLRGLSDNRNILSMLLGGLLWPAWYFQVTGGALMILGGAGGMHGKWSTLSAILFETGKEVCSGYSYESAVAFAKKWLYENVAEYKAAVDAGSVVSFRCFRSFGMWVRRAYVYVDSEYAYYVTFDDRFDLVEVSKATYNEGGYWFKPIMKNGKKCP